ncbi:uncharacterized protein [Nicotiana tomentosiformis]|uniref:uncharacterized protein isoform X2 n=1 Tax=Nicotiana tomentosiformis TaxID=4098 RepID=UPI00388CAEEA
MTTNSKKHKGNPPKSASTDKEGQLKLYSPDYAVKVNTSYQQKSDDQNKNMVKEEGVKKMKQKKESEEKEKVTAAVEGKKEDDGGPLVTPSAIRLTSRI